MRKYFVLFFCLFLLTGCEKEYKQEIKSINKSDYAYVSIYYPVTGINKLDIKIEEYINDVYSNFDTIYSNELVPELNITYTYNTINSRYVSVSLNTFINNGIDKTNTVATFNYDKEHKSFIDAEDIVNKGRLEYVFKKEIASKYKTCDIKCIKAAKIENFTLDDKSLTVYLNSKDLNLTSTEVNDLELSLNDLNLALSLDKKVKLSNKYQNSKRTINPNSKVVALTFDDGPSKHTNKILNTLERENARATFFVVGNKASFYQELLLKMVAGGNEIGNHSYSHKLLTRLSSEEFKKDIDKTQSIIFETTGYTPRTIRPTYGGYSDKLMSNTDLKLTLWDVDSSDWRYKSENRIVKNVLNYVEDGDIILMHDTFARTASSVEKIIKALKKEGYIFVTVSELDDIKKQRNNQR